MNHKIDAISHTIAGLAGSSMALAPAVLNKPFYQSEWWLGLIAILGATVLVLTIVNLVRGLIKSRKK